MLGDLIVERLADTFEAILGVEEGVVGWGASAVLGLLDKTAEYPEVRLINCQGYIALMSGDDDIFYSEPSPSLLTWHRTIAPYTPADTLGTEGSKWLRSYVQRLYVPPSATDPADPVLGDFYLNTALSYRQPEFWDDDAWIKFFVDYVGDLPAASENYRGKMWRVEGGAGVADKLYTCMKKADDTYAWVQIASG